MQRIMDWCVDIVGLLYSAREPSAAFCYYLQIIQNYSFHDINQMTEDLNNSVISSFSCPINLPSCFGKTSKQNIQ